MARETGLDVAAADYASEAPSDFGAGMLSLGRVDLTDPEQAGAAIAAVVAMFGRIDVLFNVAGAFSWQTVETGDVQTWERLHRLNTLTTFNASKAAAPHLISSGSGRIVNVGANAAIRAGGGMGAYAASKAGVHRLTEAMAEELKQQGVTVNAVLPSIIDTPANRSEMPDADFSAWVSLQEVATVMLFLASIQASAVTGALVPVVGRV